MTKQKQRKKSRKVNRKDKNETQVNEALISKNIHLHLAIVCEQEVESHSGICSLAVGPNLAFPKSIGFTSCTHLARNPQKAESSWVGCKYWNVTGQNPFIYSHKWTYLICYSRLLPRILHFGDVLLAQMDCRVKTEDSIKLDRERERPSIWYS